MGEMGRQFSALGTRSATWATAWDDGLDEVRFPGSQLPEDGQSFASFAVVRTNVQAVETAMLFANGIATNAVIAGPSGWGKSHLIEAGTELLTTQCREVARVMPAAEWMAGGCKPMSEALVLDHVQDALRGPKAKLMLRMALERRMRSRRRTLLVATVQDDARSLRALLPQSREWCIGLLSEPTIHDRATVLEHVARTLGLRISKRLIGILATVLKGTGRSLVGVSKRLLLESADWTQGEGELRALGLLGPYLTDNPNWDLRDLIHEVCYATESVASPGKNTRDFAIHVMLRVAQIPESQVAGYFHASPASVYARASRLHKHIAECPECLHVHDDLVGRVLDRAADSYIAR